jgi:hypothetical protein
MLPGRLVVRDSCSAAVQQCDELPREPAKIDQDALLRLKARKIVLAYVQGVEKAGVTLVRQPHSQGLHMRLGKGLQAQCIQQSVVAL